MTKQEAIRKAKQINSEERDLHQPDITHVAMSTNGLWYGYDQEPIFDEEQGEWDGWNWEIPLFEMQDDSVVIESVGEL